MLSALIVRSSNDRVQRSLYSSRRIEKAIDKLMETSKLWNKKFDHFLVEWPIVWERTRVIPFDVPSNDCRLGMF